MMKAKARFREASLYSDVKSIYNDIDIKRKHKTISVIGRSLGSGIVTYLSSARNVDKPVLITSYDSIENVARAAYPIFPISVLLKDKYRSVDNVEGIKSKTLMIIAERDDVILRASSNNLAERFNPGMLDVKVISGKTHYSMLMSKEYINVLVKFLK